MPPSTALQTKNPAQINAELSRALGLRNAGRRLEALELATALVAVAPRHADLRHLLGVLWCEAGQPARAIKEIEQAFVLAPRNAEFHNSLGIILRGTGATDQAIRALRAALALEPGFVEAHNNLSALLLEQGNLEEAARHLREALRLKPDYAEAALNLARVLARTPGAVAEAVGVLQRLVGHPAHGIAAREILITIAETAEIADLPADFSTLICDWLIKSDIAPQSLDRLSWRLVLARPKLPENPGDDVLLNVVLSRCLAVSPESERVVMELRRKAFALLDANRTAPANALNWLAPLALNAFSAGFVYPKAKDEDAITTRLRAELEATIQAGNMPDAMRLALFGVVAPLSSLAGAERLVKTPAERWPAPLRLLIERTLAQPLQEQQLRAEISNLGAISNQTSSQVRGHYEEHPFPQWTAVPAVLPRPLGAFLRERLLRDDIPSVLNDPVDILVPGCGTGHAVALAATTYKDSNVIGVDLSQASLAYGMRTCRALGLNKTKFVHGDILELGRLCRQFPYIECSGVLHHMADPLAGWQVLIDCLAPHGVMHIGLYSEIGRRSIVAGRARIQSLGLKPNDTDIRKFRQMVLEQTDDPALAPLKTYRDFYYLSGCRDLLFHEVEHRFDLPRLGQALDQLGLEFLGFNLAAPGMATLYRSAYPDDPSMCNLANWHRLESANPTIFASMYQFWCRRRTA